MSGVEKEENRFQLGPGTALQSYFVKNAIHNQQIFNTNSKSHKAIEKQKKCKNQSTRKHNKINGVNSDFSSSCGLLTRRSYGSFPFNKLDEVQFNNRASIKDNIIACDAILLNEAKRQLHFKSQQSREKMKQQKFKRHAVNVKQYQSHLKTQQISDAYYFVNQEVSKAKQRQILRENTIKRVKSLSRSKSQEIGLEFRKKQQQQLQMVRKVQQLKQTYTKVVVPSLMGTRTNFVTSVNSPRNIESAAKQKIHNQSQLLKDTRKSNAESILSKHYQQHHENEVSGLSSQTQSSLRSNSHIHTHNDFKNCLETRNSLKNSISTKANSDSLFRVLHKSKSNQEFLQKQRVKVVKQAFIQNWRQGHDKSQQKHQNIYPCKHTQNLKAQKERQKQKAKVEKAKLMYGQNALKQNPLQSQGHQSQSTFMARYDTLKQYQIKFSQIGKDKIKSCIIAKN